jgi:hypothetical protein
MLVVGKMKPSLIGRSMCGNMQVNSEDALLYTPCSASEGRKLASPSTLSDQIVSEKLARLPPSNTSRFDLRHMLTNPFHQDDCDS